MRVLHVTSSFPRRDGDGNGIFIADLAGAQAASGLEVRVLAPHGPGLPARDVVAGVPVRRFRYGPARAEVLAYRGGLLGAAATPGGAAVLTPFLASYAAAVASEVRRFRPHIVHAHWWLPSGAAAVTAARGTPVVVTCHGRDVHLALRHGVRPVARRVLRRAAVAAAVGEALAHDVAVISGRDDIQVLRMPLPTLPPPVPMPPIPPVRLLAVGRLIPEKGFDVAVAAVARLAAAGNDIRLDIVGDGPLRSRLEKAAASTGAAVRFVGALPRPDVWAALDAAHAALIPSHREGLPLVAVEAVARGRPVVGSNVGGLRETVQQPEDGILVPPGDPDRLAAAISRLPLPPPAGRAIVLHSAERVVAAHMDAYRRVARR